MAARKGSSGKGTTKSAKTGAKRSIRDLGVRNDKSRNVKGGAMKKIV